MAWDGRVLPVAGYATYTTSAAGTFTLTHNLGAVPSFVSVEPQNSGYIARADHTTATATTILVYVRNTLASGALVASTSVPLMWFAAP